MHFYQFYINYLKNIESLDVSLPKGCVAHHVTHSPYDNL